MIGLPESIITAPGKDRRNRRCLCSACQRVRVCTASFDFYEVPGQPDALWCEECFTARAQRLIFRSESL